jgi:hypothetical protein
LYALPDRQDKGGKKVVKAIKGFWEDIKCSRNKDGIETNVPWRIKKHSPTGMEWGYGGSGPADFALNILSIFIGQKEAEKNQMYQDFKWRFVSGLPEAGGTIKRLDILQWIADYREKIRRLEEGENHG